MGFHCISHSTNISHWFLTQLAFLLHYGFYDFSLKTLCKEIFSVSEFSYVCLIPVYEFSCVSLGLQLSYMYVRIFSNKLHLQFSQVCDQLLPLPFDSLLMI